MRVRLFPLCLACLLAQGAAASCADVSLASQRPLELGTIRPMYNAQGFVQLDPVEGLSFSHSNAAHDAGFGEGRVTVTGLVGTTVTIGLGILAEDKDVHPDIGLSEVIVRHGIEETRIAPPGGVFRVTLPERGTLEGLAKIAIRLGAVMRYKDSQGSQTARYRLEISCRDTAFSF